MLALGLAILSLGYHLRVCVTTRPHHSKFMRNAVATQLANKIAADARASLHPAQRSIRRLECNVTRYRWDYYRAYTLVTFDDDLSVVSTVEALRATQVVDEIASQVNFLVERMID